MLRNLCCWQVGVFAIALISAVPMAGAQPVVGRDALIEGLVPVTGDPIRRIDLRIEFQTNSADLTESALAQLNELAFALQSDALKALAVEINGHTDASGSAEYNQTLSERRAEAVAAWLADERGIDRARLSVQGFGESRLLDTAEPTSSRNRRVEIVTRGTPNPAPAPPPDSPAPPGGMRAIN